MTVYVIAEYLRLSSEDIDLKETKKAESNSISNQRALLNAHIAKIPEFSEAEVVEFCDDGWSGKNFDRPAVQEMLSQVRQGKIQCVIVKDLSRFGRDYLTVENYVSRIFPFLGVRFIAVNDGIDSIRPMDVDNLDTSFRALLYDLYSRDLSRKVRGAKRQRAQRGDFVSRYAPYGYVKDPHKKAHLVIDPPAAAIVQRIFRLIGAGKSAVQTAKILNDDGILTPMLYKLAMGCTQKNWNSVQAENYWTDSAIIRIIRDEQYLGKVVYGKRYYDVIGQKHSVKVRKKDWIITEHAHEAIITQEEFDRAQDALREYVERDSFPDRQPLRKKLCCGICGHAMARKEAKAPYYICRTSSMTNTYPCAGTKILEKDLFTLVLDGLHTQAAAALEVNTIWEERHRQDRKDIRAMLVQLGALKDTLNQVKHQSDKLYKSFVLGEINRESYSSQRTALKAETDELSARIATLTASIESNNTDGGSQNRFVDVFRQYAEVQKLTDEIVADVLKQIRVFPNQSIEIAWNYQDDFQKLVSSGYLKEATD